MLLLSGSLIALPFPMIFVWALTFVIAMLCEDFLDGIHYAHNVYWDDVFYYN